MKTVKLNKNPIGKTHNINIALLKKELKKNLSTERYEHSCSVEQCTVELGTIYGLEEEKLRWSALFHDFAKYYTALELDEYCLENRIPVEDYERRSHAFLHGKVGSDLAFREYGIKDQEVLDAIFYHTTGRACMNDYEEVLFISDYCEPLRGLESSKRIVQLAQKNRKQAVLEVLIEKMNYVFSRRQFLSPRSVSAYNFYQKFAQDSS